MKQFFKYLNIAFIVMACSMSITSCSDDEAEKGSKSVKFIPGALFDEEGVLPEGYRIKSVYEGNYSLFWYKYSDKGDLNSVSTFQMLEIIEKNDKTIKWTSRVDDDDETSKMECTAKLNANGFIESVEASGESPDYGEKWSEQSFYTYNSNHQLETVTLKETGTVGDDTYENTCIVKHEYKNDILIKSTETWTGTWYDDPETNTYEYSDFIENPYYQWILCVADDDFGVYDEFAMLGYYGKASAGLPQKIEYTEYGYSNSKKMSYSFNEYGALKSVGFNSNLYTYTYTTTGLNN